MNSSNTTTPSSEATPPDPREIYKNLKVEGEYFTRIWWPHPLEINQPIYVVLEVEGEYWVSPMCESMKNSNKDTGPFEDFIHAMVVATNMMSQ